MANLPRVTLDWWLEQNLKEALGEDLKATPASRGAALERLGRYLGAFQRDRLNDLDQRPTSEILARLPEALLVLNGGKADSPEKLRARRKLIAKQYLKLEEPKDLAADPAAFDWENPEKYIKSK